MYIELHAASAFSFLDGASLPEALVERAATLGYPALALLDRDGVYGVAAVSSRREESRAQGDRRRRADGGDSAPRAQDRALGGQAAFARRIVLRDGCRIRCPCSSSPARAIAISAGWSRA